MVRKGRPGKYQSRVIGFDPKWVDPLAFEIAERQSIIFECYGCQNETVLKEVGAQLKELEGDSYCSTCFKERQRLAKLKA